MAAALSVAADVVSNVYTVVVNGGTLGSPVPIESTSVEVGSTAGGDTTTAAFNEVVFAPNSIFRKQGTGYLLSSLAMGAFTGEIRIEEGAFIVNTNNQMGVTTSADGAPVVKVSSGASLVIDTSEATVPMKQMKVYNTLYLGGEGVDGIGALCMRNRNSLQDQLFYGPWHLTEDAVIVAFFNQRWDLNGAVTIYMHGHNLLYRRAPSASGRSLMGPCGIVFDNTDPGAPPVTVTVDHEGFQLQGSPRFRGTAADRLIFTNDCEHVIYGFTPICGWTTINSGRSSFSISSSQVKYPNPDSSTYWDGAIEMLNGEMSFSTTTTNQGMRFLGPISGTGSFYTQGNLAFCGTNSFTGSIGVNCTRTQTRHGVMFKGGVSVPAALTALALTNSSSIFLPNANTDISFVNGAVAIPDISVKTDATCTDAATEGVVSNMVAGAFRKTGAGKFVVNTPLSVSGTLDVKEGTLAFGCSSAGLVAGRCLAANKTDFYTPGGKHWTSSSVCAHDTTETWTNLVQLAPGANVAGYDVLDCLWPGESSTANSQMLLMYNGWIWNRGAETATWTFAGSFGTHTTLWIDDVQLYQYTQYQTWKKQSVSLTPGPHKIRLTTYSTLGGIEPNGTSFTNISWKISGKSAGFRYDPQGRDSNNINDYLEFKDPGDGSLLTVSTNGVAAWRPNYSAGTLRVAKGATLDLGGSAFDAGLLAGFGVITNSNPHITGEVYVKDGLKVTAVDANAATGAMKLYVPLVIAEGASVVCENLAEFPHSAEPLTLLETVEPIKGLANLSFTRTPGTPSRKWHLEAGADGKSVRLAYACGTVVLFR